MGPWNLSERDGYLAWYDATVRDASRYAARLAGADLAPDLVQDAYVALLRRARAGELHADGPGLVITTVRNRFIDTLRSGEAEQRRVRLLHAVAPEAAPDPAATPDDPTTGLPARERAALVLRYVDGLTVAEVAHALGTSVRAAESLLSRGKQRARTMHERTRTHG